MTAPAINLDSVSVNYGRTKALDGVTGSIAAGTVTGLLGRNAAGKSTLLATIAGFRRPSRGRVLVGGQEPFENDPAMAQVCLIREAGDLLTSSSVRANLSLARDLRSHWDRELEERLLARFRLPLRKNVDKLSRGQRSSLAALIGLASRAPLTIFDEVYLGMDAPNRLVFFEELLAEQIREPRTVIISSHFMEEAERLLEYAVILHQGRILLHDDVDSLGDLGVRVIGPVGKARAFTGGCRVLGEQLLGGIAAISIHGALDQAARRHAAELGLELERLSLQDLYTSLTGEGDHTAQVAAAA